MLGNQLLDLFTDMRTTVVAEDLPMQMLDIQSLSFRHNPAFRNGGLECGELRVTFRIGGSACQFGNRDFPKSSILYPI
jgi:hypothetical protein